MFTALALAFRQLPEPEMRRPLILTVCLSALLFAALFVTVGWFIGHAFQGSPLIEWVVGILGALAAPLLTWFLFPCVAISVLGLFSDSIIAAVEHRYYPTLPPPPPLRWLDLLWSSLRLVLIGIVANIVVVPFYLLAPGMNLVLFLALNGYLLGREYFDSVALRRMDDRAARHFWRAHRRVFVTVGAIVAAMFLVPVLNLAAPIVGMATIVHLVERWRPEAGTMGRECRD